MTERPMLFSGPMVREILAGRKTQTRRAIKPQPKVLKNGTWYAPYAADPTNWCYLLGDRQQCWAKCPYGSAGDRLWVRETFVHIADAYDGMGDQTYYRAGHPDSPDWTKTNDEWLRARGLKWKPSIHMPRAKSRISLIITNVRVQRLHDISEEDARAEGVQRYAAGHGYVSDTEVAIDPGWANFASHRAGFMTVWEEINGLASREANPWVWCVSFRTEQAKQEAA